MSKNIINVAIEQHFIEHNGCIYTDIAFSYSYWKEYLEVFDSVHPIARIRHTDILPEGMLRADGDGVEFIKINDYLGFWDFLVKAPRLFCDSFKATRNDGCFLLRMGNISNLCWIWLMLRRRPYAFEVVGHAGESIERLKNLKTLSLGKVIAWLNHNITKLQCRYASCTSFVSEYVKTLYPPGKSKHAWVFSGVQLKDGVLTGPRPSNAFMHQPMRIISVGRIEPEKGHRILVDALDRTNKAGLKFQVKIVGPGQEITSLKQVTAKYHLENVIEFTGAIPWGPELFKLLDWADLFVLPSLTEGMPRALIEAMARGLPAIGSNTGGICELLTSDCLVTPASSSELADKLTEIVQKPDMMANLSKINSDKAQAYRPEVMNLRKYAFWNCLKNKVSNGYEKSV